MSTLCFLENLVLNFTLESLYIRESRTGKKTSASLVRERSDTLFWSSPSCQRNLLLKIENNQFCVLL